ncbi:hypothetical protein GUITHDRAFT_102544 [Guillardia theta CCMP2712]|uniref:Major facilitator superfamily (MFS) profile domain-containing protein n=1 Tax=Guillardia theta (strain CCMP2712) TaxID=905079 RepID=L1JV23_GUITC|nr:hypothetical protein GUITHDRAFT_102544 [Guillardia theta CCMP2712]EKX51933.1 hypothetical protein GUITHDRAFT_102544 [Guillardia theta CCMP2712]|eukprot:XP_005838913.1 hypothetical protein GUITHDRAFT_102544 [Guillardia theta CCMP2712]
MLTKSASRDNTATVIGLGHASRAACGIIAPTIGGFIMQQAGARGVGLSCLGSMGLALSYWQLSSKHLTWGAKKGEKEL